MKKRRHYTTNQSTKIAFHIQEARKHLDALSTVHLANDLGITKQALQSRINVYKEEEHE